MPLSSNRQFINLLDCAKKLDQDKHVEGGKATYDYVVCNCVAQSMVDSVRGQQEGFVFVWRRERVVDLGKKPLMSYSPIQTMNNTAWQRARKVAELGDLHVHDLRHTVGMRLRESGVQEGTISDLLWHRTANMTRHYCVAQIVELHAALEKVKEDSGRWNKSLQTLRREQEALRLNATPPNIPQAKKNSLRANAPKLLF